MNAADLNRWIVAFQGAVLSAKDSISDKGLKYFLRPIALGMAAAFAAYNFVYKLSATSLVSTTQDLDAARATEKYAGTYKELQDKIVHFQNRFPKGKAPEVWLTDSIRESLRREEIEATSFSPPQAETHDGFRFVTVNVRGTVSYKQIAAWIVDLEKEGAVLHIKSLNLSKDFANQGKNSVDISVAMVVPEGGAAGQEASKDAGGNNP
jgi:hypothetical protein